MKQSIMVIVKPPGDATKMAELRRGVVSLRSAGHRVRVRVTFEAGDARRFARAASLAGWNVVVAAGGDGTINEVVNGLAAARGASALGVVPLGTANDFAKGLGIPLDIAAALRIASGSESVLVDVARVNRRCFINVSTGGFGADATRSAGQGVKRLLGRLAYMFRGAQKLIEFEPRHARFIVDGACVHDGPFAFFAVGNARQTGGGTQITPLAAVNDRMLDMVLVGDVSRLDLLSLLPDLRSGTHLESPDVHYFRAYRFDIEGRQPDAKRDDSDESDHIAVNADGELVAGRSFRYEILPRPQRVMIEA